MLLETTMRRGRHLLLSLTAVAFCYGLLATSVQACNLASKLAHPTAAAPLVLPQALTGVTTADEHPENGPRSIIGLWKVDVFLQGTQIDAGFESLYADGNELIVDQSPPATDNVCTGVWEQTGPLTYKINHPAWDFDLNGNLLYIVVFHETITLDRHGNTYTGTEYLETYDLAGNQVGPPSPEFTLTGTRIRVNSNPL